jgi:hypothetical protein
MIKPFVDGSKRAFRENAVELVVGQRKGPECFLTASLPGRGPFEMWLKFLPGKEEFRLLLVESPEASARADLFRYRPAAASVPGAFWVDARFLPCFYEEAVSSFIVPAPSFTDIAVILGHLKVPAEEASSRLGCSLEKLDKFVSGYYLQNAQEARNVSMRGLPGWADLNRIAVIPEEFVLKVHELTSRALSVVFAEGLDQFTALRDQAVGMHYGAES